VEADMTTFTKEEIEAQCAAEYEAVVGKVVLIHTVECYDEEMANATIGCDPPLIARIDAYDGGATDQCVIRWMDSENCDPVYDIEILEHHPVFAEEKVHPSWIYGTSRSTLGTTERASFVIGDAALQEAYADALPVHYNDDGTKKETAPAVGPSMVP
jgi:hypothetical protein